MTRFQRELSGELGEFWKKEAEKQLDKVRAELAEGKISIDAEGVARNCIGRVLMDDLLEQLGIATDKVNAEATRAARRRKTLHFWLSIGHGAMLQVLRSWRKCGPPSALVLLWWMH